MAVHIEYPSQLRIIALAVNAAIAIAYSLLTALVLPSSARLR
jgi:hypothetical protein